MLRRYIFINFIRRSNFIRKLIHQEKDGTITVFLSLILILILSMLLTIIEGARVDTAKVFSQRALTSAMDSVLSQYYGPLWEEYHIFGYYEESKVQDQILKDKLDEGIKFTLAPSTDLKIKNSTDIYNFYDTEIQEIVIKNKTALTDYQGELFRNEAVEYMKYRELGNGIQFLLDKLNLLETPKQLSYVYDKKQKAEEELVEIDRGLLELMELLDGVRTSKNGIVVKNGTLSANQSFVKKICLEAPTMEHVAINRNEVFQVLKPYYVNPGESVSLIIDNLKTLSEQEEKYSDFNNQLEGIVEAIKVKNNELDKLNSLPSKTHEVAAEIFLKEQEIKSLKQRKKEVEKNYSEQNKAMDELLNSIKKSTKNLNKLLDDIKPIISTSISCLNTLILKTKVAAPLIKEYQDYLESNKGVMEAEIFKELKKEAQGLEKYIGSGENDYDFIGMKTILEKNLSSLNQVEVLIGQGESQLSKQKWEDCKDSYQDVAERLKQYNIKGLKLDYSSLVIDKKNMDNPINEMNNLLSQSMLSFIIDPKLLSDSELPKNILPSDVAKMSSSNTDFFKQFQEFFKAASSQKSSDGVPSIFGSLGQNFDFTSFITNGVNTVADGLLYQEYLKEHFYYFNNNKKDKQKPSALSYELEYLISGKSSDVQNLTSVIMRIALIRTALDFAAVISDSVKRNEAKALAMALVGFTGLPILVGVIQTVILLAWAFCEALYDVCALMMGKEVPILKKTVELQLPELFLINRTYLQNKAKDMNNSKNLTFSYMDYLNLFLFIKNRTDLAYNTMDLVQENLKLRYDLDKFQMEHCLFGFEVEAQFVIPSNFTNLNIVNKVFTNKDKGFPYHTKASYSY